jgi:hypothetical protein
MIHNGICARSEMLRIVPTISSAENINVIIRAQRLGEGTIFMASVWLAGEMLPPVPAGSCVPLATIETGQMPI